MTSPAGHGPPAHEAAETTTDPDELLEVLDAEGHPTGVAKTRAAIHRDGDWHLAFFCWILRDGADVVLQKRAATKDVWPGRFDASAAGHVRFGETPREAAREIEEELGVKADPSALEPLFRHRQEHVHASGLVDREVHDVHLMRCELPLEDYRPGPEVSGLVAVPLEELIALASGARPSIDTTLVTLEGEDGGARTARREPCTLRRDDIVPYDAGYLERLAEAAYSGRASIARR